MSEYVVTLRGEPVAVLRPLTEEEVRQLRQAEIDAALPICCLGGSIE